MLPSVQLVLDNLSFKRELDSDEDIHTDYTLGKRNMADKVVDCILECPQPQRKFFRQDKKLPELKVLHEVQMKEAVSVNRLTIDCPNGMSDDSTCDKDSDSDCIASSDEGSVRNGHNSILSLLENTKESHKVLLKHFIFEAIANEKINTRRFEMLPDICKAHIHQFFQQCFGYDLAKETKTGSCRKHLYNLYNYSQGVLSSQQRSRKSFAFATECYLYGLQKQLGLTASEGDRQKMVEKLYSIIHPNGSNNIITLSIFQKVLFDVVNDKQGTNENEVLAVLTPKLIGKIRQLPVSVLNKYYLIKVKRFLSELVDGCKSADSVSESLANLSERIDLFSNYSLDPAVTGKKYKLALIETVMN